MSICSILSFCLLTHQKSIDIRQNKAVYCWLSWVNYGFFFSRVIINSNGPLFDKYFVLITFRDSSRKKENRKVLLHRIEWSYFLIDEVHSVYIFVCVSVCVFGEFVDKYTPMSVHIIVHTYPSDQRIFALIHNHLGAYNLNDI